MAVEPGSPLSRAEIRAAARERLGHQRLLPGQAEAVTAVAAGRDTLAILPTGGGKSAIYQLAGLEIDGPTIVVSPLIALQRDQLQALDELGLVGAALNSSVPPGERDATLDRFESGDLEFLLLAPEQLAGRALLDRLSAAHPSLLVVDEAHCVSEWGRDFRPEYARLGSAADELGRPTILALTATASPPVRDEIVERLGLRDPVVVARGFDRPNISLEVEMFADPDAKRRALVDRAGAAARSGAGIVYVATRRAANEVAVALRETGIAADPYHAGLGARRRTEIQDAFMAGELRAIVATIAFGMGVDKPDVRWVHHLDVSESLDAYHQEIGRAGRDGEPAEARLFYRAEDLGLRRFQAAAPGFAEADVRAILRAVRRRQRDARRPTIAELAASTDRSRRRTEAVLARLADLGALQVAVTGEVGVVDPAGHGPGERPRVGARDESPAPPDQDDLPTLAVQAQERRRQIDRSRVDMIRAYAEADGCRRRILLNYFGEPFDAPCGNCDRCRAGLGEPATQSVGGGAAAAGPFALNDRVVHATFGPGLVAGLEGRRLTVMFDESGYRTLDLAAVATQGLLVHER
jgi:ATP-dependent DNA helicase RecQ